MRKILIGLLVGLVFAGAAYAGIDNPGASPTLNATTAAIGGSLLTAGGCASGTVAVTGSTTAMTVSITPNTYPGDGTMMFGYVSAAGTVTVKVCGLIALTPVSSTYNVRVIQ